MHDSLVQFAYELKQKSLRCAFDNSEDYSERQDAALALQLSLEDHLSRDAHTSTFPVDLYHQNSQHQSPLGLSGKVSKCARDLVGSCRKCGIIVCRNCIEKPPSNSRLPGRLRRLCDACIEAPLILHTAPMHSPEVLHSSSGSTRSNRSDSNSSETIEDEHLADPGIESVAEIPELWRRSPCTCASRGVYLCHQCAHSNISQDNIYHRVWQWRCRYSTHMGGGLGTGLGLGSQGQKCGRGQHCLAKRDAMALIETDGGTQVVTPMDVSRSGTPAQSDEPRPEPGYFRQEIEGIGGRVKSKFKQLVKVGATVYEFGDERKSGKYLGREAEGELRAYCSWCSRVCPSKIECQGST